MISGDKYTNVHYEIFYHVASYKKIIISLVQYLITYPTQWMG